MYGGTRVREELAGLLADQGEDDGFSSEVLELFDAASAKGKAEILSLFRQGGRRLVIEARDRVSARWGLN